MMKKKNEIGEGNEMKEKKWDWILFVFWKKM